MSRIAANPNTSPDLLAELSESYPEYVAVNPYLQIALIENVRWVALHLSYECVKLIQHTTAVPLLEMRRERHAENYGGLECRICGEVDCYCEEGEEYDEEE